jgi:hypothetical protein
MVLPFQFLLKRPGHRLLEPSSQGRLLILEDASRTGAQDQGGFEAIDGVVLEVKAIHLLLDLTHQAMEPKLWSAHPNPVLSAPPVAPARCPSVPMRHQSHQAVFPVTHESQHDAVTIFKMASYFQLEFLGQGHGPAKGVDEHILV